MLELGRTEEVIREMDKLANEDHTHIATEEELNFFRSNWWIRSNFVGSDTMPIRHRPDFKEALSTLHRLKKAEDQAYYQNWWQREKDSGEERVTAKSKPMMNLVSRCSSERCKEYTSYYRKLATKTVYIQHEQQHEH